MSGPRKTALIAAGLFVLNVAVNAPLFLPGEHKYRESSEGGYASMARFLSEYPNPFGWNPWQYKGLPTHDWYLPLVPYTSAVAIKILPFLRPEHVYRLVVVTCVCLGPATMFLLILEFVRSRRWALGGALVYMFLSASYLLFPAIKADQGITYVPWRIQVLVKYGEGPHSVGLVLLPLALIACWRAALGRRFAQLALAAAALSAVALTNWVAALGLAWCCLMMLLAGPASSSETGFLGRRILMACLLAYLLACFWLTPEYIATNFLNWPVDSSGFPAGILKFQYLAILIAVPAAIAAVFRWWPGRYYLCYVLLCLAGFTWVVAVHYWFHVDVIPEANRYAAEFEFFFFAAVTEIFRLLTTSGHRALRGVALLSAALAAPYFSSLHPWEYLTRTWVQLRPAPRFTTIEYQVSQRLADLRPRGRVFVTGGTRLRLNSWFPLHQSGGTFEAGLRNRGAADMMLQIQNGPERPREARGNDALNMLRASGVEYAVIHFPGSREHWHEVVDPELVVSKLETVWRQGEDGIYRVPFTSLANFVLPTELPVTKPVARNAGTLESYVRAMDEPGRPPMEADWKDNNHLELRTPQVHEGQLITVRVSHHPGWTATQDGEPIAVRSDAMGNILLEPRVTSGQSLFQLSYRPSWQQVTNSAVGFLAAVGCMIGIWRERQRVSGA
jgi:hypothetical protein